MQFLWITLSTQPCLVLYSFCANLLHSLIMWLIVSSLSPPSLHLLFCCIIIIIWFSVLFSIFTILHRVFTQDLAWGKVSMFFASSFERYFSVVLIVLSLKRWAVSRSAFLCISYRLGLPDILSMCLSGTALVLWCHIFHFLLPGLGFTFIILIYPTPPQGQTLTGI